MHDIWTKTGMALLMALGMAWKTGWSLVLGFTISSVMQSLVPSSKMKDYLGKGTAKEIVLASAAGAASSSCSYASAAIMRTLFKKGAALVNALAFLFASTNLVIELGVILLLLMGWQFMLGEWIGGVVLITIMAVLVKLTYPKKLVEEARNHEERSKGHEHMSMAVEGDTWRDRVRNPKMKVSVAQNFAMEWSMLWKDMLAGFVIAGFLAAFVPDSFWKALFLTDASEWIKVPVNAVLGPVIAVLTFVCSIGNVPFAAILFSGGISFGGVLAFLYADLIILPLINTYRRYFGWKFAAYMAGILFVTMVAAALIMDVAFSLLGIIPEGTIDIRNRLTEFSLDYTFWLNILFGALAVWLFRLNHKHPMDHSHNHDHDGHDHGAHDHHAHMHHQHGH
ncbi:permease [Rhizobium sp. NRK18]|uniref:permease n=1 Tax=Rhizobium sp. NRK18 TaxID=2964667 RepID=UPI0021C2E2C0|nr:permease [Rhizobium sp. NRK18]MCQ2003658.1 permease [Rhizobium sp. NRK18]